MAQGLLSGREESGPEPDTTLQKERSMDSLPKDLYGISVKSAIRKIPVRNNNNYKNFPFLVNIFFFFFG